MSRLKEFQVCTRVLQNLGVYIPGHCLCDSDYFRTVFSFNSEFKAEHRSEIGTVTQVHDIYKHFFFVTPDRTPEIVADV